MPFSDIFKIIVFIVPGFITTRIFANHFAGIKDTDFGRVVSSIIYSIICLFLTKWVTPIFNITFTMDSADIITASTAILLFISFLLGYGLIGFEKLKRYVFDKSTHELSSWAEINSGIGKGKWVIVKLKDSTIYRGWIDTWKYDPDSPNDFDFFVGGASAIDENLKTKYRINGPGVYVRISEVSHIEFLN